MSKDKGLREILTRVMRHGGKDAEFSLACEICKEIETDILKLIPSEDEILDILIENIDWEDRHSGNAVTAIYALIIKGLKGKNGQRTKS